MDEILQAVEDALDAQNWYAALFMSLSAPDICSALESENGRGTRSIYAAWFDQYVGPRYRHRMGPTREEHVFLSGNDCYALRCAALHRGGADITEERCREALDSFHLTTTGPHNNQIDRVLQLDVATFCRDICSGVRDWQDKWREESSQNAPKVEQLLKVHTGPSSVGGLVRFD